MGAQAVSHGVAEEDSPRREPWGKMRHHQKPPPGATELGPKRISFRRFAAPVANTADAVGLPSTAAPQLIATVLKN